MTAKAHLSARDWIQWLLERGWTVRAPGARRVWQWRTPHGISGDDYESPDFDVLPPAVETHIFEAAIMVDTSSPKLFLQ